MSKEQEEMQQANRGTYRAAVTRRTERGTGRTNGDTHKPGT